MNKHFKIYGHITPHRQTVLKAYNFLKLSLKKHWLCVQSQELEKGSDWILNISKSFNSSNCDYNQVSGKSFQSSDGKLTLVYTVFTKT